MHPRSRENQLKFLPRTPTHSSSQPSLSLCDYEIPFFTMEELENPLSEQSKFFEELIEKEKPILLI